MFAYKNLTTAFVLALGIMSVSMVVPQSSFAGWTDWYVPTQYAGYTGDYGTWTNPTNATSWDDAFYMTNDTAFGNPAPQKWLKGFGVYAPELIGKTFSQVEVRVRLRRRFNTTPTTSFEVYVLKSNDDLTTALNASTTDFSDTINFQSFTTKTYFWRDTATNPWVTEYFPVYDPQQLWIVLASQLNASSGSSNFLDVAGIDIRFYAGDTTASETIPQNPSELQISIENLQDTLKVKAPFAYFYAVSDFDFDTITEQELTFDFPVPFPTGTVHFYATLPQQLKDSLGIIRTITGVGIMGSVVFYLFSLGNRVI